MGELERRARTLLHLLQLLSHPLIDPLHTGNGSRNHNTRLGIEGIAHRLSPLLPTETEFWAVGKQQQTEYHREE